jgi:hypothetical protein
MRKSIVVGIYLASFFVAGHFYDAIHIGMSESQVDKQLPRIYSKKVLDVKDTLWAKRYTNIPTNGYVGQYWIWHIQPVEVVFNADHTVEIALPAYE